MLISTAVFLFVFLSPNKNSMQAPPSCTPRMPTRCSVPWWSKLLGSASWISWWPCFGIWECSTLCPMRMTQLFTTALGNPSSSFLWQAEVLIFFSGCFVLTDPVRVSFHACLKSNVSPYSLMPLNRFYHLNKRGRVVNCPYVDNSYKWAGGGFLSTVGDLLLFGNALLYSFQVAQVKDSKGLLPGFLQPQTVKDLWAPVDRTEASWDKDGLYAQGWLVVEKLQKYGQCRKRRHYVSHTGGAVGASSVLLVLPSDEIDQRQGQIPVLPQGVVVTIVTNMQSVGLNSTALKIAHEFDRARSL